MTTAPTPPTTHPVGIERLRELYSMLWGVPKESLDLGSWRTIKHKGATSRNFLQKATQPGCGTTACAVGWACAYPPFQAQGLGFSDSTPVTGRGSQVRSNWNSVQSFFEISFDDAFFIFSRHAGCPTWMKPSDFQPSTRMRDKQVVLARIRMYLLHKGVITRERSKELKKQEATL